MAAILSNQRAVPEQPLMHLAVFQPQVPGNTGTLGRMCVGLHAWLHIIGPCAFDFSSKAVRRAGLDYWPDLRWTLHPDPAAFLAWLGDRRPWLVSEHGATRWDHAGYALGDVIILGNEVAGIPADWHERWPQRGIHLPILGPVRSYNVANAGAAVLLTAIANAGGFAGFQSPPPPASASGW